MTKIPPSQQLQQQIEQLWRQGSDGTASILSTVLRLGAQRVVQELLEHEVTDCLGRCISSGCSPAFIDLSPEKWTQERFPRSLTIDTGGETMHPPHHRTHTWAFKRPVNRGLSGRSPSRARGDPPFVLDHSLIRHGIRRYDGGGEAARRDPRPPRRLPTELSLAEQNAWLKAEDASRTNCGPGKGGKATTGPPCGHRDIAGSGWPPSWRAPRRADAFSEVGCPQGRVKARWMRAGTD